MEIRLGMDLLEPWKLPFSPEFEVRWRQIPQELRK